MTWIYFYFEIKWPNSDFVFNLSTFLSAFIVNISSVIAFCSMKLPAFRNLNANIRLSPNAWSVEPWRTLYPPEPSSSFTDQLYWRDFIIQKMITSSIIVGTLICCENQWWQVRFSEYRKTYISVRMNYLRYIQLIEKHGDA